MGSLSQPLKPTNPAIKHPEGLRYRKIATL